MRKILVLLLLTGGAMSVYLYPEVDTQEWPEKIIRFYDENKGDSLQSKSIGTTGNGSLEHGKLMPFRGKNYFYFSQKSYLMGRAFTTDKVQKATLATYRKLAKLYPNRQFGLMECSNKNGGKLWPHYTHQNGQSIDFMSPLLKDGKAYTQLDHKGISHYWLEFDDQGRFAGDTAISIDFDLLAHHILLLDREARNHGIKIAKVILMLELKDELFATQYGKQLKKKGIYFAQRLSNLVNKEHDDHYHVDFGPIQ